MVALLAVEVVVRRVSGLGVPGGLPLVQHLTLWLGFLGAAYAARHGRLLALAAGELFPVPLRRGAAIFAAGIAAAVAVLFARASFDLVRIERDAGGVIALGIPVWVAQAILPIALIAVAGRLVWRASPDRSGRALAALGIVAGLALGQWPLWTVDASPIWGLVLVAAAAIAGAPLFAVLGGAALWLFLASGVPIAAVPAESYRLAVHPTLPSIPLFTLAGFLLAEGRSADRLIALLRAAVGWMPGGTAVVAALVCAFFTTFTGRSGVTILALGPLLFAALASDGYRDRFSLGLLTTSGSLGLLFAPAAPLIFYGIVGKVPIDDLFLAGILPGLLLVSVVAARGFVEGRKFAAVSAFSARELARAAWTAKWEVALPVIVLAAMFSGWATAVEAAAIAAVWSGLVVCVAHRDIPLRRLPHVLVECGTLIGGVLIILAAAQGLTSYLVDAQVPSALLAWTQEHVDSRWLFLLLLNLLLLVVGCLMDIFSAIVVVVPLIAPLGLAFGVDPVHLAIIFIANLELGYLTPPVGLNLFLASYRFERPLLEVVRAVLPWLALLAVAVLVLTYVPWLSLALLAR